MNAKTSNGHILKKISLGAVASISICAMLSSGMSQIVKASAINLLTTYSPTTNTVKQSTILPPGYVKAAYNIKLTESSVKPNVTDISSEQAAELGAQNLWRIFRANLSNKTLEVSYKSSTPVQPHGEWTGRVTMDSMLSYSFIVDATTGEYYATAQTKYWNENINTAMDKALLKNPEKYTALAKDVAQKFRFISGKVISSEYVSQGSISNASGKNSDITLILTSDNGHQAQLTFSRYNQELLSVEFDGWLKDSKLLEAQAVKDMKKATANCPTKVITNEDIDNALTKGPTTITQHIDKNK
jgi:hypothetical protein